MGGMQSKAATVSTQQQQQHQGQPQQRPQQRVFDPATREALLEIARSPLHLQGKKIDANSTTTPATAALNLTVMSNRLMMAPMTRGMCGDDDCIPNERVCEYYGRRAEGGFGAIVTEGVYLHPSLCRDGIPHIGTDAAVAAWQKVSHSIRERSAGKCLPIMQLWHPGFSGAVPIYPVELRRNDGSPFAKGATKEDLEQIKQWYVVAAVNAVRAGFAIAIHGAHGYFLDAMLSPERNKRTDEYGGADSVENRVRFCVEVIRAIRGAIGPDVAIVFRLSQWEVGHYDAVKYRDPAEFKAVLEALVEAGVDSIDVSTRRIVEPAWPTAHPTRTLAGWAASILNDTTVKRRFGSNKHVPIIGVGSVTLARQFGEHSQQFELRDPMPALEMLKTVTTDASNEPGIDVVAVGRAALADPSFAKKVLADKWTELVPYSNAASAQYP